VDFVEAILKPLEEVNFNLKIFRKRSIYKVVNNGQVVYLQAVLNDQYDRDQRRIYIDSAELKDPLYIYAQNELKDVYLGEEYLYSQNETDTSASVDFIVYIPVEYRPFSPRDLEIFLIQMRSLINYYKLASKRYKIIFI